MVEYQIRPTRIQILYVDNRSVSNQTLTDRWDKDSCNNYNIFAGLNYELSSKSNLRVQYSGEFKNGTENVNSTQTNSNPLEQISIHRTISADGTQDRYTNTASASYQLQRNMNSSLNLVADFTNRRINKYKSQAEQDMKNEPKYIILNNESDYNAYTFDGNYSFMIGKNSYETIGLSAGTLNNDSRSIEDEISQNIDRTNRYINMYATFSRDWGNFSTELGLRYEYDYTRTNYFSNIENNNIIKEYSNLYPSVSASYKFGKNRLTASYTRESFKPSFYEINPIKTYIDSLHYYMGNPELKPSYSNNYSFTFNISKVTLNFIYSHQDNGIRNAYYQEDTSPNIIIEKPENIGKSDYFKLSINYNYSIKGLNLYLQGQLSHSTSDYFYLGENIKEKQFNAMINWMASYNIKKKWNIFLNGWYISPKLASGMNMGHSLCTNFGASTSFFKKKLNITLAIYDIFNNMVSPSSVTIKSNNVYYHKKNDYDTRSLSLTVRYTFNTVKTKFKESSGNKDLLDRVIDK
ncbi:MAG: outer membrane beta-barrel family protein [Muribaculaceae bacterium]